MKNHWARTVLFVLLSLQVSGLVSWTETDYQPEFANKFASQAEIAKLNDIIQGANGPILADEYMGLLPLAGKRLYYEPFEFNQLSQAGLWDQAPMLQDVTTEKFSTIMIYFPSDFSITRARWSDQFIRIISAAYNNPQILADTLVYTPKK